MKKLKYIIISTIILFLGVAIFLIGGFYFPTNIKGEKIEKKLYGIENDSLVANNGIKLHVFNTGMNKVSSLLVGANPWRPAPAFVIEHPEYGLIVFDSGLSTNIAIKGKKALHLITGMLFDAHTEIGRDLPSQMREANLMPEDVKKMIYSHLHFDHIGNSDQFINATYYFGAETKLNSLKKINGFEPDFMSTIINDRPIEEINFIDGFRYATFEKAVDLLGDNSIIVIQGNGHQTGSICLFINLPNGPVLLSGDEVVHFDWLYSDDIQHLAENKNRAANFRNQVRMLLELMPNLVLFPGHDLSKAPKNRKDIILHNPEFYKKEGWDVK
ncbi:MAG: MBL fold metallo-hydrolase [Fidelibacterota bacterium]